MSKDDLFNKPSQENDSAPQEQKPLWPGWEKSPDKGPGTGSPAPAAPAAPDFNYETLGEYMRKVRLANRIDLHKMAQDTKLTLDYLNAIEKNDYEKIPGETYRKIFLKNVAKYLGLNPEDIYARYLKEAGLAEAASAVPTAPETAKPGVTAVEPPISTPAAVPSSSSRDNNSKTILAVLGSLLAVFLLLMLTQNGKNEAVEPQPAVRSTEAERGLSDSFQKVQDSAAASEAGTTSPSESTDPQNDAAETASAAQETQSQPARTSDTAKTVAAASETLSASETDRRDRFRPETSGNLRVELTCLKDSTWVFSFRNKKTWNNLFKTGDSKVFASDSAIYFRLSYADRVSFKLNGKELMQTTPPEGSRNNIIKIDQAGLSYISKREWNSLLKRR